jgi:hypothetical protein
VVLPPAVPHTRLSSPFSPYFFKHHIYHLGAGVAQSVLRGGCELDSPKFEISTAARDYPLVHLIQAL